MNTDVKYVFYPQKTQMNANKVLVHGCTQINRGGFLVRPKIYSYTTYLVLFSRRGAKHAKRAVFFNKKKIINMTFACFASLREYVADKFELV